MLKNKKNNNRANEPSEDQESSCESDQIASTYKSVQDDVSQEIELDDDTINVVSKKAKKQSAGQKTRAARKKVETHDEADRNDTRQVNESSSRRKKREASKTEDDENNNARPKKKQRLTKSTAQSAQDDTFCEEIVTIDTGVEQPSRRSRGNLASEFRARRQVGDDFVDVVTWLRLKQDNDAQSRKENVANTMEFYFRNGIWQNSNFSLDPQSTRGTFAPILLYVYLLFSGLFEGSVLKEISYTAAEFGREILDVIECSGIQQKIHEHTGMYPETINKAMATLEKLKLICRVKKTVSILLPPPIPKLEHESPKQENEVPIQRLKEFMSLVKLMKMEDAVFIKGLNDK